MEDEGNDILHAHQFISVCQLIREGTRAKQLMRRPQIRVAIKK
jgi:hypothetical protein